LDCDDWFPGDRVVFFDTSMLSEAPSTEDQAFGAVPPALGASSTQRR
jgi:hypothetical protein